jgi:DNA polymerase-3 subunit epsilon
MTGLDVDRDRIIEVCVERVLGGEVVAKYVSLVNPGVAYSNSDIHGIVPSMTDIAPTFSEISQDVLRIVDGAVFVAHAAQFDVGFLKVEFQRCGIAFACPHFLDTLVLSRRSFALPGHSLDELCKHFGLVRPQAHRAEHDVWAMRKVWDHAIAELKPTTARDLWEVRIGERVARAHLLAVCSEALAQNGPIHVSYRPRRKPAEHFDFVVTSIISELDPPRVLGYQLPGRGRRELRADRVLSVEPAKPGTS